LLIYLFLTACKPVPPVTSSIVIDLEMPSTSVNTELYGLTLEEINHAIEGGIYAELIRNRSFEAGVVPAGCSYDAFSNSLVTPSGWHVPFVSPNTVPGWRILSEQTGLFIDTWSRPLNEANQRSLWVYVPYQGKGGVVAEGFGGIPVRRGEQYDLSLFVRGQRNAAVKIELRNALAGHPLSEPAIIPYTREWTLVRHTFTATDSDPAGTLVFSADSSALFNLDLVSLSPAGVHDGLPARLRPDLMEALAALSPQFVRFPGGASVEGYASQSLPAWDETLALPELRRSLWTMYGYETNQGLGFHDFLVMCEYLQAKPVYVVNAGLLNQRYRTRYPEQPLEYWTRQLTAAIAYATAPVDSAPGRMRRANGHAMPFDLGRVEIGSEHRGREYLRRYRQLRDALDEHVALIANTLDCVTDFQREWVDTHYHANADYLISSHNCFNLPAMTLETPLRFIGEFGASHAPEAGTLRAAVGEAAFLTGAEQNPQNVKGVAYSPILGHDRFPLYGHPAILFDASRIAKSPSYYMLEMFASNRGDELLATNVRTYHKPMVRVGGAEVILYDYQFGVKDLKWNGEAVPTAFVKDIRTNYRRTGVPVMLGETEIFAIPEAFDFEEQQQKVVETQQIANVGGQPADVFRRYMTFGDTTRYNYTISATIKEVQPGGAIEIHVRDNGQVEERTDHISLTFRGGKAGLYHCGGAVATPLAEPVPVTFDPGEWRRVGIVCNDERIQCYLDDQLIIDAVVPSHPSLLTVATLEKATNTVILKVVNTTYHEEWCSLDMRGRRFFGDVEMTQLAGHPDARNTLDAPDAITPRKEKLKFPFQRPATYAFPANSITVLRFKVR
jgi:alpha-L-arabinofuranosidase